MSQAETPESPPRDARLKAGAKRAVRWTLWAVIALAIVVAALPFMLSTGWAKGVIQGWLDENVDRKVEFESLDVSWSEGIKLKGLTVHDEFEGKPPLLVAPSIVIRTPLWSLVTRSVKVEEFLVEDAVLTLSRKDDGELNTAGVMKRRKARRAAAAKPEEKTADAPAEDLVLPEIRVPVEVRNLTLVFRRDDGYEARQKGVSFRGDLTTRDGPTKFDIRIPDAAQGSIKARGSVAIFANDGLLLPREEWQVVAAVDIKGIDAKANGDILKLFLGETPACGIVDAELGVMTRGEDARGNVDITVRGVAFGDAVARKAGDTREDLTVKASFERTAGVVTLKGLRIRADGLAVDGDVAGAWPAGLAGKVTLDADLGRIQATLAALGMDLGARKLAGVAKGEVTFVKDPSSAAGALTLTNFRAEGFVTGAAPVVVDRSEMTFRMTPSAEGIKIDAFDVKLPGLAANVAGTQSKDGDVDIRATAQGDLGGLLARVRDLGFLPQEFSVNGSLDAAVRLAGRSASAGGTGFTTTIEKLTLTESDVRIEATGSLAADGAIDMTAKGEGDLGKLLGRAKTAGAAAGGVDPSAIRGRFAFDASAKGPAGALVLSLPRFRLDGDLQIDASGEYRPDGALAAKVRAQGKVEEALALAKRLGIDVNLPAGSLTGTFDADADVRGTAKVPEVPKFTLKLATGPLSMDVTGAIAADKSIRASATGSGDVELLRDLAIRAGFVEAPKVPAARGRLTFDVTAAGNTDAVALPTIVAKLRDSHADVDVTAALETSGRISGGVLVTASLDELARFARSSGYVAKDLRPGGTLRLTATVGGTRSHIQVPQAELTITGPAKIDVKASYDATETIHAAGTLTGALQPILDLAAQWTGEAPRRLDGTIDAAFGVDGTLAKPLATLPKLDIRAGTLAVSVRGAREADGALKADANVRGGVDELLRVLGAFGVAADVEATGALDATVGVSLTGPKALANVVATVASLDLRKPLVGGAPFRESRIALTMPRIDYDLDTGRLEPVDVTFEGTGLNLTAKVAMTQGPPERDGTAQRLVSATGSAFVDEAFVKNHSEMFGPDISFARAELPFRFEGDVAHGRTNAAGWTGGFDASVTSFRAPHLVVETLTTTGKFDGGVLTLHPLKGAVNGGTLDGRIALGLVGEKPRHRIELTGKDITIDGNLAPLVAKVSPLFGGENGKMGGKVGVTMDLAASGLDGKSIESTLDGQGVMDLDGAYVESTDLVGAILELLGSGGRMEFAKTKVPFTVKDGKVRTGDLAMDAAGLAMRIGGDVDLASQKIDYGFRIKPTKAGGAMDKYLTFLDPEGFLPLRIKGTLTKPKLRAPDLKDALKNQLEGALDGLLGGKKDEKKDPPKTDEEPAPPKKGGKGRNRKTEGTGGTEEPPPPPPTKTEEPAETPPPPPPPKKDPQPPETPPTEEPPPPPPPPKKKTET